MTEVCQENVGFGFWGDGEGGTSKSVRPHDYRERATRLRALAASSPDPQIRTYLLTTAAQFDRLADYAAASAGTTHAA